MLTEVIDKTRALVDGQFDEAEHAMLALGDVQLQPTHASLDEQSRFNK